MKISDEELIAEYKEQALAALIKRHSGMIFKLVNSFNFKIIPEEDRKQACNIGILMAIKEFKPELENKFLTFAYWKMRGELTKLQLSEYPWADGRDMQYPINMLSIDNKRDDDVDIIPPDNSMGDINRAQADIEKVLSCACHGIKLHHLEILFHAHALFDYEELTHNEIAERYRISRQRVQQIINSTYELIKYRMTKTEKVNVKDYI